MMNEIKIPDVTQVIDFERYSTRTAKLIAVEYKYKFTIFGKTIRSIKSYLFVTDKGAFFTVGYFLHDYFLRPITKYGAAKLVSHEQFRYTLLVDYGEYFAEYQITYA